MIYTELCGEKVSRLGFGAMRLPTIDPADPRGQIDKEAAIALIRSAYEQGITYFDTAYVYGGGESETILGEALGIYPRDSYCLATKFPGLHPPKGGWNMDNVKATFEEQLKKLGTDYIDFYLLHGIMESDIHLYTDPNVPLADYFYQQKQTGRIRHFGFSSHGKPDTLKSVLEWKDYFEFCQIQLNYLDWTLQNAKAQYELLVEAGLPVLVMEPVRGGKLVHLGEELESSMKQMRPDDSIAAWSFRFLKGLPGVKVVLSGMTYPDQLEDNLKTFGDEEGLTEKQQQFLFDSVVPTLLDAVPCTACRYCCEGCPRKLDIPTLISIYNEMRYGGWSFRLHGLKEEELPKNCVACGKCKKVCPQGIDIPGVLKKMAEMGA